MVCGPIGAGKTTVARRLALAHGALRFSLDEWVMQLFGAEAPDPMIFEWWAERCKRCSERIWSIARDLLAQNVDVVLDFGFPGTAQREEWRCRALQAGATVHLHVVTADSELRWQRVQGRNLHQPETFALVVTKEMFGGSEVWWEPPSDLESDGPVSFHTSDEPGYGVPT
jgi:predicted kinase